MSSKKTTTKVSKVSNLALSVLLLAFTLLVQSLNAFPATYNNYPQSDFHRQRYYVGFKAEKPILVFDSSFDGHQQQQASQIDFDGDVYFSNAQPSWEQDDYHLKYNNNNEVHSSASRRYHTQVQTPRTITRF